MQQIIPGFHTFTGLMAGRVYLIENANGLTLIDTSIASAGPKILQQLAAAGHQPSDVKHILLTHSHPDHVGGLPYLKKMTGAIVMASELEAGVVEGRAAVAVRSAAPRPPQTWYPGTPVGRILADGDELPEVKAGMKAVFTPGHSPGHLAFWLPQEKLLFCGDVIFHIPFNMGLPLGMLTVDRDENIRSIGRLAKLNPETICFGHGKPLRDNTAERLRQFAQKVGA